MGSTVDIGQIGIAATNVAQQLSGIVGSAESTMLKNTSAVNIMYLGKDNTVSPTTGWPLAPGQSVAIDLINARLVWVYGTINDRIAYWSLKP